MMLAEPTSHPDAARERTVELMFEQHGAPALFLARDAVLASFATGRQTALVVDAGHDATTGEKEERRRGHTPPVGPPPLFFFVRLSLFPLFFILQSGGPLPRARAAPPGPAAARGTARKKHANQKNAPHPPSTAPAQMSSFSMLCLSA